MVFFFVHPQVERQTSDMFEKMQGQLRHLESELSHSRAMREKEARERAREKREERERAEREKEALKQQHEEQVEEMVREHQRERDRLQRNLEEKRVRWILSKGVVTCMCHHRAENFCWANFHPTYMCLSLHYRNISWE